MSKKTITNETGLTIETDYDEEVEIVNGLGLMQYQVMKDNDLSILKEG